MIAIKLPIIKAKNGYKRQITRFGGLNLTRDFSDGEFCAADGISHINYPSVSQRHKMRTVPIYKNPTNAVMCGKECVADSGVLYYDGKKVGDLSEGQKEMCVIGSIVIVFPDKVYYNTETEKFGDMTATHIFGEAEVTFSDDSLTVPEYYYETTASINELEISPNTTLNTYTNITENGGVLSKSGSLALDISGVTPGMYTDYSCENNEYRIVTNVLWDEEKNKYTMESELVALKRKDIAEFSDFKEGDSVEISGCSTVTGNNINANIQSVNGRTLVFPSGTFTQGSDTNVTIKRRIPDFSCICTYENRLWGCEKNTIYASKLGDPFNFFLYNSLSTDSYTVQSNTAEDFTACVPFGSYCIFFKENSIYKLYGSRPSNFQLVKGFGSGITKGCGLSAALCGGTLFYYGNGGIYAYAGGAAQLISQKLGDIQLQNAAGGSDGKIYFLAADTSEGRKLFAYDTEHGLWSAEGETSLSGFFYCNGKLYAMCPGGMKEILNEPDENADWSVTLHPFDEGYFNTKDYTRIRICAELYGGAYLCAEVKRDSENWETVMNTYGDETRHISIPIKCGGSHKLSLRLSGRGKCILESVVREFSVN